MPRHYLLILLLLTAVPLWGAESDSDKEERGDVGIELGQKQSSGLTISNVLTSSPAEKAGVKAGDVLVEVEGIPVAGKSLQDVSKSLQGDIGTTVALTIRNSSGANQKLSLEREADFELLSGAASSGDARMEYLLAQFYMTGPEKFRSRIRAAEWYEKSAQQGFAAAETMLGYIYQYGLGRPKDMAMAFKWYRLSADQGNASAEAYLGYMYQYGFGVSPDSVEAVKWYRKAAVQGNMYGERQLALSYRTGQGIEQSDREAYNWYYSAALMGDKFAEDALGYFYQQGIVVPQNETEALKWYLKSAEQGNVEAILAVASIYELGRGVPKDTAAAVAWYKRVLRVAPDYQVAIQKVNLLTANGAAQLSTSRANLHSRSKKPIAKKILMILLVIVSPFYLFGLVKMCQVRLGTVNEPPTIWAAVGCIGFYLVGQVFGIYIILFLFDGVSSSTAIPYACFFGGIPVIISSFMPQNRHLWQRSLQPAKTLFKYAACGLWIIFSINGGNTALYRVVSQKTIPQQPTHEILKENIQTPVNVPTEGKQPILESWARPVTLFFLIVLAPVVEELMFRSYLFQALRRKFSDEAVIVITGLSFSTYHFQLYYTIPLFGLGLVLGWLRCKTGSVRLPMAVHMLNNSIASLTLF